MERKFFAIPVACLIMLFVITLEAKAQNEEWKKIAGPWLWMIAPTEEGKGGADSIETDSLDKASNGVIDEKKIAKEGANEGEQVGEYQWHVGFIDVDPPGFADVLFGDGNINKTLRQIGMIGLGVDLDDHSSYALITVFSNSEQEGQIKFSSDDSIKIWLNGDDVGTVAKNRSADAKKFQNVANVKLKQGSNLLMVKVSERKGKWAMYVGLDVPDLIVFKKAARTIDLKGPWLWMVAKGGPKDLLNDLLSSQYGFGDENYRAKHGAYRGERQGKNNTEEAIGDSVYWRSGVLNEDRNVNECLIQNGMLKGEVDHYTAYALINIFSVQDNLKVKLRVGSDDAARVWLNGMPVYIYQGHRSTDSYQDEKEVRLKQGDNLLMVKVSDYNRDWRLFVGLDLPIPEHGNISVSLPPTPVNIWEKRKQLPVTIEPDPPISEIAFGNESTYFVFTTKYPRFEWEYRDAVIYGPCMIILDMKGIPGFTEGYEAEDEISSNQPIYFMIPLIDADDSTYGFPENQQFPGWAGTVAKKGVSILGGYVGGQAVRKKLIKAAVGKTSVGKTADKAVSIVDGGIEVIAVLADALVVEGLSFLLDFVFPEKSDPIAFVEDPSFVLPAAGANPRGLIDLCKQEYLFMVDHRHLKELGFESLEEITISVVQQYKFQWEETAEAPDKIYLAKYEDTFNLKTGTWVSASSNQSDSNGNSPIIRSMSLADYPPFQRISPDVQEYLLRQFGEFGNTAGWEIPEVTSLLPNYPNPFNPETWLPYQLSEPADVTLTIYDIQGRVVRNLDLGHQRAGMYHSRSRAAHWDGRNAQGEPIASGLYFYTLKAGDFAATRKMLIRK